MEKDTSMPAHVCWRDLSGPELCTPIGSNWRYLRPHSAACSQGRWALTTCDFILYPSLSLLTPSLSSLSLLTQVVAVEGINNYSGSLIPNAIYDQVTRSLLPANSLLKGFTHVVSSQGVFPPLPKRTQDTVGGVSSWPTLWLSIAILCLQDSHC